MEEKNGQECGMECITKKKIKRRDDKNMKKLKKKRKWINKTMNEINKKRGIIG